MKIILTKTEFEKFAFSALKAKYDKLCPEGEETVSTQKYDGTVEIEFIPKEGEGKT